MSTHPPRVTFCRTPAQGRDQRPVCAVGALGPSSACSRTSASSRSICTWGPREQAFSRSTVLAPVVAAGFEGRSEYFPEQLHRLSASSRPCGPALTSGTYGQLILSWLPPRAVSQPPWAFPHVLCCHLRVVSSAIPPSSCPGPSSSWTAPYCEFGGFSAHLRQAHHVRAWQSSFLSLRLVLPPGFAQIKSFILMRSRLTIFHLTERALGVQPKHCLDLESHFLQVLYFCTFTLNSDPFFFSI